MVDNTNMLKKEEVFKDLGLNLLKVTLIKTCCFNIKTLDLVGLK